MNSKQEPEQPKEPVIEYLIVDDEFNILDEVFDELFEQVEKEIKQ